jgi:hypothetical protein
MRKRYRILTLAALVAALAVPVGYALSPESAPVSSHGSYGTARLVESAAVLAPMAPRAADRSPARTAPPVPDAAKLFGAGTILFGLAAALRKSKHR